MDKQTAKSIIADLQKRYHIAGKWTITPRKMRMGEYALQLLIRHKQRYVGDLTEWEDVLTTTDPYKFEDQIRILFTQKKHDHF